jgi:hypothetical protein
MPVDAIRSAIPGGGRGRSGILVLLSGMALLAAAFLDPIPSYAVEAYGVQPAVRCCGHRCDLGSDTDRLGARLRRVRQLHRNCDALGRIAARPARSSSCGRGGPPLSPPGCAPPRDRLCSELHAHVRRCEMVTPWRLPVGAEGPSRRPGPQR